MRDALFDFARNDGCALAVPFSPQVQAALANASQMALEVWQGNKRMPDVVLAPGAPVSFGRRKSCTYCTSDVRVSGEHLLFAQREDGKDTVVDLSSNGTFVNGARMTKNQVRRAEHVALHSLAHVSSVRSCVRRWWCSSMATSSRP